MANQTITPLPAPQETAAPTVGLVSLGCSKNQVDAERMLAMLQQAGFALRQDPALSDVAIINTCGFIEAAKQESIDYILEFGTLKEENRIKVLVVTGCLAERYQSELAKELPEVDVLLGIGSNRHIVRAIQKALDGERIEMYGDKTDLSLEGPRILGNLPYFAYLKIAEGCDNCCTYCAIPSIRGRFRSRTMEDIVEEAEYLASIGVTELNVVAQDSTRYGEDIYGEYKLAELLQKLAAIPQIRWIRTLYCYPERITPELLEVMATEEKVVKYLDLPLQHCNEDILRRMNRQGDENWLRQLIADIRSQVPGIVIRTTFITGFPGETEEQFEELCHFVEDMEFDRMGCFPYSAEEDTPAAMFPNQVDEEVKERRAEVLMDIQYSIHARKAEALVGTVQTVLVEGFDRYADSWVGRSYRDAPDVDSKVFFTTETALQPGDYVDVKIEDSMDYDLIGSVLA